MFSGLVGGPGLFFNRTRAAMKPGLEQGVQEEVSFEVTEQMCPAFDGEVVHQVCATWTLVHYMEVAGRKILMRFLEPDEEGIGSHVSCDHLRPAPVGREVRVTATVSRMDDRELICDVAAYCGEQLIASGKTGQKVLPRAVLKRILHSD